MRLAKILLSAFAASSGFNDASELGIRPKIGSTGHLGRTNPAVWASNENWQIVYELFG